jgi:hypothetical protein
MIDWEDLTATDFLPSERYFAGFAGDHDPWLLHELSTRSRA